MFRTVRDAFKVKEIRQRLFFTFLMLIVVRIGSQLPLPGVDPDVFQKLFGNTGDSLNFFNALTGGSFEQMSVFALSITPYITSSIIIQLLTISFPKLEEMQRDGEEGRKKLNRLTRYVTILLSVIEALAMAIGFGRSGYLSHFNFPYVLMMVAVLTAGATALMWIGERITKNGVGNGISIVLVINIVSRLPQDVTTLYNQFIKGQTIARGILYGAIIVAIIVGIVVLVVILQCAERRIPVQYSRKLQGVGRASYSAANSTYIPLKVNTGGVIPVIFAQSLMQTPVIIAALAGKSNGKGVGYTILNMLSESHWFTPSNWLYSIGAIVYVLLLIAFAYFYTSITFNPLEIADNMKKSGGFVPGIRPGKPTSDYLTKVLNSIIFIGAVGLTIVSILPIMLNGLTGANVSFGGTSIIIIVGVVVETVKQIEGQMMVRNYKGFLTD